MSNFEQIYATNEINSELPELCLMLGVEKLFDMYPFYRVRAFLNQQEVPSHLLGEPDWVLPLLLNQAAVGAEYHVDMTQFNGKWRTLTFRKDGEEKPDGWTLVKSTFCGSHERRQVPA